MLKFSQVITFRSTKETDRQLSKLCDLFGESKTRVIMRAIEQLYFTKFDHNKKAV